jgi:(2Fe-2S) ferredoxin
VTRRYKVIVCRGPECGDKRESRLVHVAFQAAIAGRRLTAAVELGWQSCFGRCTQGPNVLGTELADGPPERRFAFATMPVGRAGRSALYNGCTPDDAAEIIEQHVIAGTLVRRLIAPIAVRRPAPAAEAPPIPPQDPDRRSDGEG